MQGSGTFGVESVLTSVIGADEKLLICAKGAYGERMEDIVKHAGIDYTIYHEKYDRVPDAGKVNEILKNDPAITHVSMVHSETTSGILNDIESVAKVGRRMGNRLYHQQCKQMHPGRTGIFLHHCKQTETDRIQRQSKKPFS